MFKLCDFILSQPEACSSRASTPPHADRLFSPSRPNELRWTILSFWSETAREVESLGLKNEGAKRRPE